MPAGSTKYRERVRTVDAMHYDGTNKDEVIAFADGVVVENPDGTLQMNPAPGISVELPSGFWVMKDMGGLWSAISDELFDLYYQPGGP